MKNITNSQFIKAAQFYSGTKWSFYAILKSHFILTFLTSKRQKEMLYQKLIQDLDI